MSNFAIHVNTDLVEANHSFEDVHNYNQKQSISDHHIISMPENKTITTELFEYWFRSYYDGMHRYCYTMTRSQSEAEDVVQAVFMDLWNDRHKIEIHTSVQAYLYKGVYYKCMNKAKHQKIERKYLAGIQEQSYSKGDPAVESEVVQKINQAIESLPDQCKKIFLLSRNEGLKYLEIADTLNLSVKTIENQMGKALKILRVALSDYLNFIVFTILFLLK